MHMLENIKTHVISYIIGEKNKRIGIQYTAKKKKNVHKSLFIVHIIH